MRNLRKLMSMGLPILGMILVFTAVLVPSISLNLQLQIGVVLVGLLIIEAGVWQFTSKVLPNERKFLALRKEVDDFIGLIRVLNARGHDLHFKETETAKEAFRETIAALHASVDRMAGMAGQEV